MSTIPAAPPTRRSPVWLLLLLIGMVALGLWSSRPPPPRGVEDPQPLLQLYRQGVPRELLTALPLHPTDEYRVAAEVPLEFTPALFFAAGDGGWRELTPSERRQTGKVMEIFYPKQAPRPLGGTPGLRLVLAVGGEVAPTLAEVQAAFGAEPWPTLPRYTLIHFTRKRLEVTGPKGPKLAKPEETVAVETRLQAGAKKLGTLYPFFVGIAVPCVE